MKETNLKKQQEENLSDFEAGQINILKWLERQFNREIQEIENLEPSQILNLTGEEFLMAQAKTKIFKHYLNQIKKIQNTIQGE